MSAKNGVCVQTDKLRRVATVWTSDVPRGLGTASTEASVGEGAGGKYFGVVFAAIQSVHDDFIQSVVGCLIDAKGVCEQVGEGLENAARILDETDDAIAEGARQQEQRVARV